MGAEIAVYIRASSIYESSTIKVHCSSISPFAIARWKGNLVYVHEGSFLPGEGVKAEKTVNNRYQLVLELQGWFREVTTSKRWYKRDKLISYGSRFYPFVSSVLEGFLISSLGGTFTSIELELPHDYRMIWYGASVKGRIGESHEALHEVNEKRSRYFFFFPKREMNNAVLIQIPVRLAGIKLFHLIQIPLYYELMAMAPLAAVAFGPASTDLVIGTVAAVFAFLLEKLDVPSLPQRSTFLLHFYLWMGFFLIVWTFAWAFLRWAALALLVPFGFGWVAFMRAVQTFSSTGRLPKWLETYWAMRVYQADRAIRLAKGK